MILPQAFIINLSGSGKVEVLDLIGKLSCSEEVKLTLENALGANISGIAKVFMMEI